MGYPSFNINKGHHVQKCQSIRQSDGSIICHRCNFIWDYDDTDIPTCLSTRNIELIKIYKLLK